MKYLYNLLIQLFEWSLPLFGLFFSRLKIFHQERKKTKAEFDDYIIANKKPIVWVHVASLGEYEQVVPVIKGLKMHFKNYSFLISFFSDSGYRVKKNNSIGDFETYLPLDTSKNAKAFVDKVNPVFAVFVKYDIWPNYLNCLNSKKIDAFLIASRFRSNQIYFKFYGHFFRKALKSFQYIFVQDKSSGNLLSRIEIRNWKLSGDTRYDRVSLQLEQDNRLNFMENFLMGAPCMVCGSTWPEGEEQLMPCINDKNINQKYVIAPHQINQKHINDITKSLKKSHIKYSDIKNQDLSLYDILILDTVGLLVKVYAYADLAYVGGGFGNSGLHNILEPAAFGVPIIIGPNHKKFPEAEALQKHGGLFVVTHAEEMHTKIKLLRENEVLKNKMSQASKTFISSQKGATIISIKGILENLSL
jgi:3-deoxy-D-manno-octulosonic-acid transferase